jgi:hypothetical protein
MIILANSTGNYGVAQLTHQVIEPEIKLLPKHRLFQLFKTIAIAGYIGGVQNQVFVSK